MSKPSQPETSATGITAVDETTETRNNARLAILELANMISVPMSLNAVVRLHVADAIWASGANLPLLASEILTKLPESSATSDAENLQRVLRMLASYGVFEEHFSISLDSTVERRYTLTEIGKTLVTDSTGLSYGAYVMQHHQDELVKSWPLLHTAILDPSTEPFTKANGSSAYYYYGKDDEMNGLMQRAMAGVSVPFMKAVLGSGYDGFNGVKTLVDVGGSSGDCLKMIVEKYEGIVQAINFDLPEVVAKAPEIHGITHVGGDMFKSIPSADTIFMKWVLTTWTDDEVIKIMKNCYSSLPKGGKLIASEPILPEKSDESHRTRALLEGDIFIMTIYRAKGKHRTEEEYRQLGLSAGFINLKVIHVDYFYALMEFHK